MNWPRELYDDGVSDCFFPAKDRGVVGTQKLCMEKSSHIYFSPLRYVRKENSFIFLHSFYQSIILLTNWFWLFAVGFTLVFYCCLCFKKGVWDEICHNQHKVLLFYFERNMLQGFIFSIKEYMPFGFAVTSASTWLRHRHVW